MAPKGKGLGKGLGSLFSDMAEISKGTLPNVADISQEEEKTAKMIKVRDIEPNRHQPRKVFDEAELNDLADSDMYREAAALLTDARRAAPDTDTRDTFHNYGGVVPKGLLDYVFTSEEISPLVFRVIDDRPDGAYLSDHYGVYVDLAL